MQSAPKEYHDPGYQLCKIMQDRYGRCETGVEAGGLVTLGHVHSSAFRSLALTALRFASHHLPCFPDCPVGRMTPLACRAAPAPAAAKARSSHPLRGMLVAVDVVTHQLK